ncbi:MAG: EAL domain-containing protein [Betaproteobacteria bacterium]|nr:EAL domain-containing protein [Betaproteobacteria bacterium]
MARRAPGSKWSLDDFGTGYSSLTYLTRFPIANLKIDRTVNRIPGDTNSEAIVQAVLGMAGGLGMKWSSKASDLPSGQGPGGHGRTGRPETTFSTVPWCGSRCRPSPEQSAAPGIGAGRAESGGERRFRRQALSASRRDSAGRPLLGFLGGVHGAVGRFEQRLRLRAIGG